MNYRIYRNNKSNRKIQKTRNILKTQNNLSLSLGEGRGEVLKIT